MDNIGFLTKSIEISEIQSNGNILAKFCLCDFSVNGNGVRLNRDTVETWMSSLVNQPLVGRIGYAGDFTGHNMRTATITCADGEKRKTVVFDTEAIGTFTDVAIETVDDVDYIVGSAEIWSRYPMVCELIKKRAAEGTLHTSWEISVAESHRDGNVKVIDSGCFTALCVLGKNVRPAYESSRMMEVAESFEDTEFSEALSMDISNESNKEVTKMDENEKLASAVEPETQDAPVVSEAGNPEEDKKAKPTGDENVDDPAPTDEQEDEKDDKTETSSLTVRDLRYKLECMLRNNGKDGYIDFMFPEDHTFLLKPYGCASGELEYEQYGYTVDGDAITLGDPVKVKLVATPIAMSNAIAEKTNALVEASTKISDLETQLTELSVYKEAAKKAAAEKAAAEKLEKENALKEYATKSGLITEQECSEDEAIKTMISELNENGIKELIADRLIASLAEKSQEKEIEVSSKNKPEENVACMNLYDGKSDNVECDLVSTYINKKN